MEKPTDQEFFEELCTKLSDPIAQRLVAGMGDERLIDEAINSGVFTELDRDFLKAEAEEWKDPKKATTCMFINVTKAAALKILGPEYSGLSEIPVGFLPTRQINACSIRTPRNGAIILFDSAVIYTLMFLFRSYFSLDSWRDSKPFCHDYTEDDFGMTIFILAGFCATSNLDILNKAPALDCPSISGYDKTIICHCNFTEWFILLHEYAHVILGHLSNDTAKMRIGERSVEYYKLSQEQEFEADKFAFSKILLLCKEGGLKPTDVLIGPGLLFHLLDLSETIIKSTGGVITPSHPPAAERWKRLSKLASLESEPKAYAYRFDYWFNWIKDCASDILGSATRK
ncbi:MAG: hypothetical protein ACFCUE_04240 [Candidatus Bathyarchaeia archaeon]|jgi:hypothetical protein